VIRHRHVGTTHRGWTLQYDATSDSLYWRYTDDQQLSLTLYATPNFLSKPGISLQMHNEGGEHLLTKTIATDHDPEQLGENYVRIMTRYLDDNWLVSAGGETQQ